MLACYQHWLATSACYQHLLATLACCRHWLTTLAGSDQRLATLAYYHHWIVTLNSCQNCLTGGHTVCVSSTLACRHHWLAPLACFHQWQDRPTSFAVLTDSDVGLLSSLAWLACCHWFATMTPLDFIAQSHCHHHWLRRSRRLVVVIGHLSWLAVIID